MKLEGFAIVTGSSRGLGKGIALQLAKEGYDLVIHHVSDNSAEKAEAVAEEARSLGVKAIVVKAAVENYEECTKIVQAGVDAFGNNIAVLVNNAGIASGTPFKNMKPEDYQRMIAIDLVGTLNCTHVVLPSMVAAKCGSIVNIASVCGIMGVATQVDYSAAKAGVIGFTKALAKEVGRYNIRVNSIAPGMIATEMTAEQNPESIDFLKAATPLGVLGDVEDISECLSYVVNAKFLTGQIVSPNGGLTI